MFRKRDIQRWEFIKENKKVRNQENKKTRKQENKNQESDQEKKSS